MSIPIVDSVIDRINARPSQCSIDGRLSSIFKIILLILFVLLVVLLVKSIIFSMGYSLCIPKCCRSKKKKKKSAVRHERRVTLLAIIFLLVNVLFSFPYYFASIFSTLLTHFDSTRATFTLTLKICFLLRLMTIIVECLTFSVLDQNSWSLIIRVGHSMSFRKSAAVTRKIRSTEKSIKPILQRETNHRCDAQRPLPRVPRDTRPKFSKVSTSEETETDIYEVPVMKSRKLTEEISELTSEVTEDEITKFTATPSSRLTSKRQVQQTKVPTQNTSTVGKNNKSLHSTKRYNLKEREIRKYHFTASPSPASSSSSDQASESSASLSDESESSLSVVLRPQRTPTVATATSRSTREQRQASFQLREAHPSPIRQHRAVHAIASRAIVREKEMPRSAARRKNEPREDLLIKMLENSDSV